MREFNWTAANEDKTIEDILIRHPIHYVSFHSAIMHRDASYSSFTVLVRYWLILYVLAYCYNISSIAINLMKSIKLMHWSGYMLPLNHPISFRLRGAVWNGLIHWTPFHSPSFRLIRLHCACRSLRWSEGPFATCR